MRIIYFLIIILMTSVVVASLGYQNDDGVDIFSRNCPPDNPANCNLNMDRWNITNIETAHGEEFAGDLVSNIGTKTLRWNDGTSVEHRPNNQMIIGQNVSTSSIGTMMVWGKVETTNNYKSIFSIKNTTSGTDLWQLRIMDGNDGAWYDGMTQFISRPDSLGIHANVVFNSSCCDRWDVGEWHHIAMTHNGTDTRVWFDGKEAKAHHLSALESWDWWDDQPTKYANWTLGHLWYDGNYLLGFYGELDDAMIWNITLTGKQIVDLYQKGRNLQAGEYTNPNLIAHYRFDNDWTDETGKWNIDARNFTGLKNFTDYGALDIVTETFFAYGSGDYIGGVVADYFTSRTSYYDKEIYGSAVDQIKILANSIKKGCSKFSPVLSAITSKQCIEYEGVTYLDHAEIPESLKTDGFLDIGKQASANSEAIKELNERLEILEKK